GLGLVLTWVGFSAYLPTTLATIDRRTQLLSVPGIAISLASGLWLISTWQAPLWWRQRVRLAGMVVIAAAGVVTAGNNQSYFVKYGATWENAANYLRRLATLIPAVKSETLI